MNILLSCNLSIALSNCKLFCSIEATTTLTHRGNKEFATRVAEDYTKVDLNSRERLIANLSVKITRSPDACSPADIRNLRNEGFSDKDILNLIEIIAYQNMSTRIMESLSTIE